MELWRLQGREGRQKHLSGMIKEALPQVACSPISPKQRKLILYFPGSFSAENPYKLLPIYMEHGYLPPSFLLATYCTTCCIWVGNVTMIFMKWQLMTSWKTDLELLSVCGKKMGSPYSQETMPTRPGYYPAFHQTMELSDTWQMCPAGLSGHILFRFSRSRRCIQAMQCQLK